MHDSSLYITTVTGIHCRHWCLSLSCSSQARTCEVSDNAFYSKSSSTGVFVVDSVKRSHAKKCAAPVW